MDAENIFLQNAKEELRELGANQVENESLWHLLDYLCFFVTGIDNHASKTMYNDIEHFITPLTPTPNTFVKEAGDYINVMGSDTLRWTIENDDGKVNTILVRDSLYVPNIPKWLLYYQHWEK